MKVKMRRKSHLIGALFFAVLGYFIWYFIRRAFFIPSNPSLISTLTSIFSMEVSLFFLMVFSSFFGGTLPDFLDPPFSSRHRFIAHSKVLLFILVTMCIISFVLLLTAPSPLLWFVYFFLLGYISHLFLDSLTPAGLR